MRIALAQINTHVGDYAGNAAKVLEFSKRALEKRAKLVVFPELSLFGYPPYDFLERNDQVEKQTKYLKHVLKNLPQGITAIFGAIIPNPLASKMGGKSLYNAAVIAEKGKKPRYFAKQFLPAYDVFDDSRFFEPGEETGVVKITGVGKVAISVCEDMWINTTEGGSKIYRRNPLGKISKVDLIVNISASPFARNKMKARLKTASIHAKNANVPFVYVNQVGGQDELIFDGRSFILDKTGKMIVGASLCTEDLVIADLGTKRWEHRPEEHDPSELLRQALVLGIRDFVAKTGQRSLHLGLSGGIDSALVAALAVDAVGPGKVTGLLMPGPYSSEGSVTDAKALAKNLGIKTHVVEINAIYSEVQSAVHDFAKKNDHSFKEGEVSLVEQNLQARLRGLALMTYSNATGSMLLSTANKSELATGYSTLYGDTNGGLMPIGDLLKHEIYETARVYNREREIIPNSIFEKAPSAELAPGQKDEDSLPPYDELDQAVQNIIEDKKAPKTKTEKWLVEKLAKSEFKRWQAPPILRVSSHGFGRGRRMPIAVSIEAWK